MVVRRSMSVALFSRKFGTEQKPGICCVHHDRGRSPLAHGVTVRGVWVCTGERFVGFFGVETNSASGTLETYLGCSEKKHNLTEVEHDQ